MCYEVDVLKVDDYFGMRFPYTGFGNHVFLKEVMSNFYVFFLDNFGSS